VVDAVHAGKPDATVIGEFDDEIGRSIYYLGEGSVDFVLSVWLDGYVASATEEALRPQQCPHRQNNIIDNERAVPIGQVVKARLAVIVIADQDNVTTHIIAGRVYQTFAPPSRSPGISTR
jgi:hypothetical protein